MDSETQPDTRPATVSGTNLLRFITCGSVDDGKSTLIGRMLHDSHQLLDDQMEALRADSRRFGTTGKDVLDLALLVDGLQAEREQGITIDVAYRYFATKRRKFIVADTPGHEQYTRNMVTGASTAELAILLLDARKGVLTQTRRHSHIVDLLGIRHILVAINKMDLVGYDQAVFDTIVRDYQEFAARLNVQAITYIPLSALTGENVLAPSPEMAWYQGPALLPFLETVQVEAADVAAPLRFPVQWVNRPDLDFRGYAGQVAAGAVTVGQDIVALPSGRPSRVARIVTMDGDLPRAVAGQAVTITLEDELDISRGDVLAPIAAAPLVADQFAAHVVWMAEDALMPGRGYLMRIGPTLVGCTVTRIKHRVDINNFEELAAHQLGLNDIGVCNFALDRAVALDPYRDCKPTGSFILVDRLSNATIGCGMIDFVLHRAQNVHWQKVTLDKPSRGARNGQKPCVLWFTGLSGAGKSTVADLVEQRLYAMGRHTFLLDGDNLRKGINKDLGFTAEDRVENIRRAAECAKLMVEAGLICLTALISPFAGERAMARGLFAEGEFLEIFVNTSLEVCEARDAKGLYRKARAGGIPNFTGIDSPYEPPERAELVLEGGAQSASDLADRVIDMLRQRGNI